MTTLTSKTTLWLLVGVAGVGIAAAAITITFTTTSTITTTTTPPPVQFLAGADAGPSALTNYVTSYAISGNKTYVTATVKGVPEATLAIGSFAQLANVDALSAHVVTLTTPQVTNAYVTAYTLGIYDSTNVLVGTLDLKAASPSVTFTLAALATDYAKLTLTLATGAGADNVAFSNALTLSTV
jgi:hypothetical protein